eukprot:COSAG01_NODE_170_length_23136_cov_24.853931_9_plen_58_part_00
MCVCVWAARVDGPAAKRRQLLDSLESEGVVAVKESWVIDTVCVDPHADPRSVRYVAE